jgi:hypothetical protein
MPTACASSPASSSTLDADQEWLADLNHDGDSDRIVLTGGELRFLVRMADDYVAVRDKQGRELVVDLSERVTVTCSANGVSVQTFQPPSDDAEMGALRLSGLAVEGTTGPLYLARASSSVPSSSSRASAVVAARASEPR